MGAAHEKDGRCDTFSPGNPYLHIFSHGNVREWIPIAAVCVLAVALEVDNGNRALRLLWRVIGELARL